MSLDHILLGLLREPASGYDLKHEFQEGAATFWPARLSQIYPTLKRLERRGLLTSRESPSDKGPPRRVYTRTRAGREELRRWLRSGPQRGTERFAYVGQLSFMDELGSLVETTAFMRKLRDDLADWLARLRVIEREIEAEHGSLEAVDDALFHEWSGLRMGIYSVGAKVAWCDETLDRLRRRMASAVDGAEGSEGAKGEPRSGNER